MSPTKGRLYQYINLPLPVTMGGTGSTSSTGSGSTVSSDSPAFTGTPTAPTASPGTNTTQLATTAFVETAVSGFVAEVDGTWIPADASGASLVLTVTNAVYRQIGTVVHVNTQLQYPSTGDTSNAILSGLPSTINSSVISVANTVTTAAVSFIGRFNEGAKTITFLTQQNVPVTNIQLSGATIVLTGFYFL